MVQENKKIFITEITINIRLNKCDSNRNVFDIQVYDDYIWITDIADKIYHDQLNKCIVKTYEYDDTIYCLYYSYSPDISASKEAISKELNNINQLIFEARRLIRDIS